MFPQGDIPLWVVDALASVDIEVSTTLVRGDASAMGKDGEVVLKVEGEGEPVGEE
jgi:hypothetical protein